MERVKGGWGEPRRNERAHCVTSMSVHVKYMPVRVRGVEGPGGGQANRLILRVGSGTKRGELQPARVRRTVP